MTTLYPKGVQPVIEEILRHAVDIRAALVQTETTYLADPTLSIGEKLEHVALVSLEIQSILRMMEEAVNGYSTSLPRTLERW